MRMPPLPGADGETLLMADQLGDYLEQRGGRVTDMGYDYQAGRAEVIVRAPDGTRLELTLRRVF